MGKIITPGGDGFNTFLKNNFVRYMDHSGEKWAKFG
jgi:hypothetical protein